MVRLPKWGWGLTDLWLIGIGTGSPDHLTLEGRRALRDAGLILIPRKGAGKDDLADLRHAVLSAAGAGARVAEFDMPVRDESLPYASRVERWHDEIARRWSAAMAGAAGPVALLVWGDPGLYDSTLRIAARLDPMPRVRVIPGITALQALTAAHGIPFNTVNGAVTVTTGRRLREGGWPAGAESVAVMLDGECSFQRLDPAGLSIWWGAFLGMAEEVLDEGALADAGPRIVAARAEARARHGWIMDTYLLRRTSPAREAVVLRLCSECDGPPWASLRAALADAQFAAPVDLLPHPCMNGCARPVSMALHGAGRATCFFAGVDPAADAGDIVETLHAYIAAPRGWIEDARPCGRLRECLVGRVAAI